MTRCMSCGKLKSTGPLLRQLCWCLTMLCVLCRRENQLKWVHLLLLLLLTMLMVMMLKVIRSTRVEHCYLQIKGKGKGRFAQRLVVNTPLRHSGMARVLKGSHSFTCTPRIHPLTIWTIPAFAFSAVASWYSFTDPGGMNGWVALGGWLVIYQNKCPAQLIEPGHGRLSQY